MRRRTTISLLVAAVVLVRVVVRRAAHRVTLASRTPRNTSMAQLSRLAVGADVATTTARRVFASAERRDELGRQHRRPRMKSAIGEQWNGKSHAGRTPAWKLVDRRPPGRVAGLLEHHP